MADTSLAAAQVAVTCWESANKTISLVAGSHKSSLLYAQSSASNLNNWERCEAELSFEGRTDATGRHWLERMHGPAGGHASSVTCMLETQTRVVNKSNKKKGLASTGPWQGLLACQQGIRT